jgi:hypothetical protein
MSDAKNCRPVAATNQSGSKGSPARPETARQIAAWLALLVDPESVFEIRAPKYKPPGAAMPRTPSRLFRGNELEAAARYALKVGQHAPGVYFTLNPLKEGLKPDKAAGDGDVVRRRLVLVDCDPTRKAGASATAAEKALAAEKARKIREYLSARGWPEPIAADSGNGYHLLYLVDLPADDDGLVKRVLEALAALFDTPGCKVDTSVYNPSRICKLYGTVSRKGEDTEERPHRCSRILKAPSPLAAVPLELLEALAASKPEPAPEARPEPAAASKPKAEARKHDHDQASDWVGISAAEDYSTRTDWADILTPHDWELYQEKPSGERWWTRPRKPKAEGHSATTGHKGQDCLHVFSDGAAPFKAHESYSKFQAYAALNHAGDASAAAKALYAAGYGTRQPPRHETNGQAAAGDARPAAEANGQAAEEEEPEILDRWPNADPRMFHGIAGEIVWLADPHNEGDPVGTLIQFLVGFGNLLGRGPYFRVAATRHYLNLLAVLIGLTGLGRKGTSYDVACFLLGMLDPKWRDKRIANGLVSGEGLIYHVRDELLEEQLVKGPKGAPPKRETVQVDAGVQDKRLLVVETEFSRALKAMNRDNNTLSDVLRLAFDTGNLSTMARNRPTRATAAHVSMLAHTTPADVQRHLSDTDSANGFANRFLWVAVRQSKSLPDGGELHTVNWAPIARRLAEVMESAKRVDRMARDPIAAAMWRGVYEELNAPRPGLLGSVLTRAAPLTMRLACLFALLDGSAEVGPPHLMAALALWEYCEDSARYVFGNRLGNPDAEKLLAALKDKPEGLTQRDIMVDVFKRNKTTAAVAAMLSELLTCGLIHRKSDNQTGGRPAKRWYAGRPKNEPTN